MRFGPRLFMGVGPFIAGSRCSGSRGSSPDFDYWLELLPPLLVFSIGLSMIVAPLTATVLADAGRERRRHRERDQQRRRARRGTARDRGRRRAVAGSENELDLFGFRLAMLITAALVVAGGVIGLAGIRNTR